MNYTRFVPVHKINFFSLLINLKTDGLFEFFYTFNKVLNTLNQPKFYYSRKQKEFFFILNSLIINVPIAMDISMLYAVRIGIRIR